MFEFAPFETSDFDLPLTALSDEQKRDSTPVRYWANVKNSSTRVLAQGYTIIELRHCAIASRATLTHLASTIEFIRRKDGMMEICCTLQDHGAAPGSLAALHWDLAQRFAQDIGPRHARSLQGNQGDRDVRLLLPARR